MKEAVKQESECVFLKSQLLKIEVLRDCNLQKKGFTAICCIPNPPDGSLARTKAVGCNAFAQGGSKR